MGHVASCRRQEPAGSHQGQVFNGDSGRDGPGLWASDAPAGSGSADLAFPMPCPLQAKEAASKLAKAEAGQTALTALLVFPSRPSPLAASGLP